MRYVPQLATPASEERGRPPTQLRQLFVKTGVCSRADGSAFVESERSKVLAGVYGPRATNKSEYSELAEVRCDVKLATFAGELRKTPGQTDEERGWSAALQGALEAAVLLRRYPKAAVDVFVLVLEEDGSVLASAINAASLALADAGIEMRDLVGAVSVGVGPEGPVIDLSRAEEKKNGGGLTVAALCEAGTVVQMQSHAGSSALAAQGLPLLLSFALEAIAQLKPVWATALARE